MLSSVSPSAAPESLRPPLQLCRTVPDWRVHMPAYPSDATVPATLLSIPLRSYGSPFHIAVCFRTKYSTEGHIFQQMGGVQERQPRTRGHLSYQYRSVTGYSLLIVFLDVFDEVDNEPGRGNEEGILTGRCIVHRSNL